MEVKKIIQGRVIQITKVPTNMGWVPDLLAEIGAVLTPFLLMAQYAILSIERTNFFFNDVIVWRILGPGLISLLIAPCVFFILTPLSHMLGYRPGLPLVR
jgi:hypothetical protein